VGLYSSGGGESRRSIKETSTLRDPWRSRYIGKLITTLEGKWGSVEAPKRGKKVVLLRGKRRLSGLRATPGAAEKRPGGGGEFLKRLQTKRIKWGKKPQRSSGEKGFYKNRYWGQEKGSTG